MTDKPVEYLGIVGFFVLAAFPEVGELGHALAWGFTDSEEVLYLITFVLIVPVDVADLVVGILISIIVESKNTFPTSFAIQLFVIAKVL